MLKYIVILGKYLIVRMENDEILKTIILSFKPEVYNRIVSGEKIFEHRRAFPDEEVKAYLYVSRPISAIKGILYLNNRHTLEEWLTEYKNDSDAVKRIKKYQEKYRYAMEMPKFIETTEITLKEIRESIKFNVPRSYYFIDETELLQYIIEHIKETGRIILHEDYLDISSEKICIM